MKKILTVIALLGGLSLTASPIFAWTYIYTAPPVRTSSVLYKVDATPYLPWNSGGSAKAIGMGGAFTAVADDLGGAVEYNPAGLTQLGHLDVAALAIADRTTTHNAQGKKTDKWTFTPTYAGAALRIGPLAVAISRKQPQQPPISSRKFSSMQWGNIYAPDGFGVFYDNVSEKLDTTGLKTYALTAAIKLGRLSVGANYNDINGDVTRVETGGNSANWCGNGLCNYFTNSESVNFKGYTVDAGALLDMGILRLGAAGKNIKGSVDLTRHASWTDNYVAAGLWSWPEQLMGKETLTQFAPTYTGGAALALGKILTVDMDYVTTKLQDNKTAQGKLGAQLAVIPGFLFVRGGLNADFKNMVNGVNNKTNQYFLGAGLKLAVLTVDASASLIQAKAGNDGNNMTGAVGAMLKF